MRILYNEGRVQGFSSYETYVKLHHALNPDVPPASEREWLASTLSMGSSMLLKIPASTGHQDNENWTMDVQFPSNSNLCAANTIIANFFRGAGEYGIQQADGTVNNSWANRVSDYGPLISNTAQSSPNGQVSHGGTVPMASDVVSNWTDDEKEQLANYMKIVDGIVIQPGNWKTAGNQPPQKDMEADLGDYPRVRLLFKGPITKDFEVLLTGFTISAVVRGETGIGTSTDTMYPQNGDFLGPGAFPWANKIVFCVPSSYIAYFASGAYTRKLPASAAEYQTVKDTSVIDMKTTKPETYYQSYYPDARVPTDVSEYSTLGEGTAVITVYQKKDIYPPAVYGTFVDNTGANYLHPLDVVAPGTVKMFEDATEEELKDYEDTFDGTFGMNKNTEEGTIEIVGPDGTLVPAARVSTADINYTNPGGSSAKAKAVSTTAGKNTIKAIGLSNDLPGTDYTIGSDGAGASTVGGTTANMGDMSKVSPSTSNINWAALLEALANNKSIDILGNYMKWLKAGLSHSDYPYIQFGNGLRLYISSTKPPEAGVPEGSIGIGWGFYED